MTDKKRFDWEANDKRIERANNASVIRPPGRTDKSTEHRWMKGHGKALCMRCGVIIPLKKLHRPPACIENSHEIVLSGKDGVIHDVSILEKKRV